MEEAENPIRGGPRRFIRQSVIADDLGVHRSTIGRWMDEGNFPYLEIAGKRRVTRELYEAWILEHTHPGEGPGG
jgi:predicted DNA-binding transcriptional regulator AlpA